MDSRAAAIIDNILARVLNGRDGLRRISINPYELPLGSVLPCPRCGETIRVAELSVVWPRHRTVMDAEGETACPNRTSGTIRYWSECACLGAAQARTAALSAATRSYHVEQRTGPQSALFDMAHFTFETFDPERLEGGVKLLAAAQYWLEQIRPHAVAPSYYEQVRPCLYFYSTGKGRGKTHLALALLNAARASGRHVAFADEIGYIERYWAATLEARASLSALPGERAWLTVLDDLGQRESTGAGLRDAWYDVINMRWLKRGWTIITSNWRPEQLVERGTINEATYSRLVQMTRGQLITFSGSDQRLPHSAVQESDR